MNIIFKCLIFILLLFSISHTQTISAYGIKMGMVSSELKFKTLYQTGGSQTIFNERRNGPMMGMYLRYLDMGYFDIESGFYYLQRGGKDKFELTTINQPDGTGVFLSYDIQFDYLQFQTGFRPHIKFKGIPFYILITGTIDYILSMSNVSHPRDDFNVLVLGYELGFGLEIQNLLTNNLLIEMLISDTGDIYKDPDIKPETGSYILRIGFCLYSKAQR